MSRLQHVAPDAAPAAAQALFAQIKQAVGKLPNAYATIGTLSPDSLGLLLSGDAVLGKGSLGKADIEAIRLAVQDRDTSVAEPRAMRTTVAQLLDTTRIARLVLPMPGGPTNVRHRPVSSRRTAAATSSSRPTRAGVSTTPAQLTGWSPVCGAIGLAITSASGRCCTGATKL